jgi:hypothetical protein
VRVGSLSYAMGTGDSVSTWLPAPNLDPLMFNKVFCIGFNKTGTSSMHQLFTDLGLRSWHGFYSHLPVADPVFADHQCFSDGDTHDFGLLDKAFPDSKFILTTRPFGDWLVSRIRHIEHRRSIGATGPMREEYEANPGLAVKLWIERRLHYHRLVEEYFRYRKDDLLIINICGSAGAGDALQRILAFLDLTPPPGIVLPHENARSPSDAPRTGAFREKSAVYEEVSAAFRDLGIAEDMIRSVFP